ncbi:putative transcriptional regulator, TetR family protein [Rhodococcoides trifolii]|uniref:Transcriptional regulator, TetR family protein n=1 Tax=Rhodococcoides trifolii TaxID=908250 RepID=A0A917D4H6_9NOCA|nr:TetR/AcrR family transcriptional regulator C-terminal domain-containing protein [Rhodococcus trifolii]GGG11943.1 putative transcriptional regulator, TetR family protein [Rhodococcus trifolii]
MQLRRQDVVVGALAILDEYGLADLTMRRLAGSLGVGPGALYWHFPNKQALLGAVSDLVLAPVGRPFTTSTWDGRATEAAHRLRDALLAHRDGAEVVASSLSARTVTSLVRDLLCDTMSAADLDDSDASSAADTLLYYVLGAAMDEQARLQLDSAGALTESASPIAESPSATERFGFGLELFLDGVRHRVHAMR